MIHLVDVIEYLPYRTIDIAVIKKNWTLFVLLAGIFLFGGNTHAASLDSLKTALENETEVEKQLDLLHQISDDQRFQRPVVAMQYAQRYLSLSRETNQLSHEQSALAIMTDILLKVEDFPRLLEVAREKEQLSLQHKDARGLANAYNSIGMVYHIEENWSKAKEYYEKSIEAWKQTNVGKGEVGPLNNLAKIMVQTGEIDQAEKRLQRALTINRKDNNTHWQILNLHNLGEIETLRGNRKKAMEYLELVVELSDSIGAHDEKLEGYIAIAKIERKSGRFWEARDIIERKVLPDSLATQRDLESAYRELHLIYKGAGSPRSALRCLEKAIQLEDSLAGIDLKGKLVSTEQANAMRINDRIAEMEQIRAASEQKAELKNARLNSYIYLLMLLVLVALAIGLLIAYAIKRRSNRLLSSLVQKRTEALQATHQELNTFIYRSSHEIRGAINSIQGLYDLVANHPGNQADSLEMLGTKILQLEHGQRHLIYTMELRSAKITPVELELRKCIESAVSSIKERRQGIKLEFRIEIPGNIRLVVDKWMLHIILENLLDNALVFRNPAHPAWCRISAKQNLNEIEILIEDNGLGISEDVREKAFDMFYRGNLASKGSGLGLYNVHLALNHLKGSIILESKAGSGTRVRLTLPKSSPNQAD